MNKNCPAICSTISYNSSVFLQARLNELIEQNVITFWAYIKHKGETSASGEIEKDHIHLYMEFCQNFPLCVFYDFMSEQDVEHPDKPLKCMGLRKSDFYNWVWYGIHNASYLQSKNEIREYHYELTDIVSSDIDYFNTLLSENALKETQLNRIYDLMLNGCSNGEIIQQVKPDIDITRVGWAYSGLDKLRGLDNDNKSSSFKEDKNII